MYNMTLCVIVFTEKVYVSNFKVEISENFENAFYVFAFFDMTLQKTYKVASRFLDFEKKT